MDEKMKKFIARGIKKKGQSHNIILQVNDSLDLEFDAVRLWNVGNRNTWPRQVNVCLH